MIAVVVPSYKVRKHILAVLAAMPEIVDRIYVVDDACPEQSGRHVLEACNDARVHVIFNAVNMGVGGAVMAGYRKAMDDGAQVIVKIDGDGQMDPALIEAFIRPILDLSADYTKGNRFYHPHALSAMPRMRVFGNAVLSFMSKLSTGYWNIFDPTNGYTAISATAAAQVMEHALSERYFFETDMLFRLNTIRAVVVDVPMRPKYEDEESNLSIKRIVLEFLYNHVRNTCKRIAYNYYLRDTSIASVELLLGLPLLLFGVVFGLWQWIYGHQHAVEASAGTVMLSGLPIIVGVQLVLAFLNYDIASVPRNAITRQHGTSA